MDEILQEMTDGMFKRTDGISLIDDLRLEQTEGVNPPLKIEHVVDDVPVDGARLLPGDDKQSAAAKTAQDIVDYVLSRDLID